MNIIKHLPTNRFFKNRKEAKEAMTLSGFNSALARHEFEWIPETGDPND
jgi:hypothetical protein